MSRKPTVKVVEAPSVTAMEDYYTYRCVACPPDITSFRTRSKAEAAEAAQEHLDRAHSRDR